MTATRPGSPLRRALPGLAGAALSLAAVTVLARAVGFGRVAVFAQTVGPTCLGSTYTTANTVPNLVFEVVAGGALATLVVPLLAGSIERGDRAMTERTASALLTWSVLLLVPVAVVVALTARPVVGLLLGDLGAGGAGCDRAAAVDAGARMLVVFAPQVVLYGVAVVLTGVLQAHRRFLGPALAPLLSSLVVAGAYLSYAAQAGGEPSLAGLSGSAELTLAGGTTLGVVALAVVVAVPLRGTGLRLRPTLAFPAGVGLRARRLAGAGAAALVAQQVSVAVALRLANDDGPPGAIVVYTVAAAVFLLPWAVLAVPIATSVFPAMAAAAEGGRTREYAAVAAASVRAVLLVTALAAGVLVAAAEPVARVLVLTAPGSPDVAALAGGLRTLAPGLLGYGLVALVGRALAAAAGARVPAVAIVTGWLVVVAADVVLVALLPARQTVAALGAGSSIGLSVAGLLLLRGLSAATGGAGVRGTGRSALAALAAGVLAAAAGLALLAALPAAGVAGSAGQALFVTVVGIAVAVGAAFMIDGAGVRELGQGLRTRRSAGD